MLHKQKNLKPLTQGLFFKRVHKVIKFNKKCLVKTIY